MQTINNLVDLLSQNLQQLYAAEEQMQQALPAIIDKVHHSSVKNSLQHHAGLTQEQKKRLVKIAALLQKKGMATAVEFSDGYINKGMSGLVDEANELLAMNIAKEVTDTLVIACMQKIEHYEISAYGTAVAYAKQLQLRDVEALLQETLKEEYDADDLLTALATAAINKEAIPEDLQLTREQPDETDEAESLDNKTSDRPVKETISERTIESPGGRAGTSHRGYSSGESRGH